MPDPKPKKSGSSATAKASANESATSEHDTTSPATTSAESSSPARTSSAPTSPAANSPGPNSPLTTKPEACVEGEATIAGSVDVLRDGDMAIEGRMPWSSNATFLVTLSIGDESVKAIYKPHKGERPLWDFPSGLYQREVAMYELAAFLGWDVIPRTVRRAGEFGIGSVQQFVDANFEQHYFTIAQDKPEALPAIRTLTVLDLLANNADRKSGHVLIEDDGHIWGIDHGLCFHEEFKLRTVLWDFAGDRIPKSIQPDVERLADCAAGSLGLLDELLDGAEIEMLLRRARKVLKKPTFPAPHSDYAYPWPMV
jgi:uncharacterized repeat protein (TIGR03843 family)